MKMDESALEEKSSFKMLGLTFASKLDQGTYINSVTKTGSKKIGALIRSMKFLSPEVAMYVYKSIIAHAENTVVTSGLVPLAATWNYQMSSKADMQDCWSFTCYLS